MNRRIALLLALEGLLAVNVAHGDCGTAPDDAAIYSRQHTVHNFNGEPDQPMSDTLAIWTPPSGEACFSLITWGPNGHECSVRGSLKPADSGKLIYDEKQGCAITFQHSGSSIILTAAKAWERWGAGGTCPQEFHCGMYGSIESGQYSPSASKSEGKEVSR